MDARQLSTNDEIQSDESYIAGFILNKLTPLDSLERGATFRMAGILAFANMPKGYPPKYKGLVISVSEKMNGKYVLIFKSTKSDNICALNEDNAIQEGLKICNSYRVKVGLNSLSRRFEEIKNLEPIDKSKKSVSKAY